MQVEYIDHMGDDLTVVNSARVSFSKHKDEMDERDEKLIKFLENNGHVSPFFHPQVTLRVQAPIPIRTQLFKHKQGLVENEESRRYITSTPQLFTPSEFRKKPQGNIKQGSEGTHLYSKIWIQAYEDSCQKAIDLYRFMVADGVAPEQARFVLPQGVEVMWYWTGSLAAFARVYNLRSAPDAQKESQEIAKMISDVIAPLFPVSWFHLTGVKNES